MCADASEELQAGFTNGANAESSATGNGSAPSVGRGATRGMRDEFARSASHQIHYEPFRHKFVLMDYHGPFTPLCHCHPLHPSHPSLTLSSSKSPSIADIVVLKITMMAFKGAVEEQDRDGKRSQALYAFPPKARFTQILGFIKTDCNKEYFQVAGTDLPKSLQNERNIVISIWRLSPRYITLMMLASVLP